ncbi:MAG: membrane protein insertase YidC [Bacteroidota bacterium]|nr:membrane protein insertase YidC [Bacteroidota bacterium]
MENKIDRNQILGFLLIGVILIGFGYFSINNAPEPQRDPETIENVDTTGNVATPLTPEPIQEALDSLSGDSIAVKESFNPEVIILENEVLEVQFSTLGAQIVSARLKNYQTYDSLPLHVIKENTILNTKVKEKDLKDMHFSGQVRGDKVVFKSLDPTRDVQLSFTLPGEGYMMDWKLSGKDLPSDPILHWEQLAIRQEKNIENERYNTTIAYLENGEDYDYLSERGNDEDIVEKVTWVANKQQFFSVILTPDQAFEKVAMESAFTAETDSQYTKVLASDLTLTGDGDHDMTLYLGPNKYKILASYGLEYEQIIPLGWGIFGWFNRLVVIKIFDWLNNYGINYGLIILIMAIMIKLVLFPLTYTSYKSMAKMRVLKPEMDEINEKFADKDPMKKQQAVMKLYQDAGVNPLGGCIPMLLQFPILIAIFRFFPASIELRQQPFLWATDLSSYDSIYNLPFNIPFYGDHVSLFTLLMTLSTLLYTWMNNQMTAQSNQMPQMKYIMYLMPIVFLGVFNNYAAGLSYYYMVANLLTFGQQWAIRSFFIDEDAIHAKLQENKKKPKKKSRFAQKMEEMAKQQGRQLPK